MINEKILNFAIKHLEAKCTNFKNNYPIRAYLDNGEQIELQDHTRTWKTVEDLKLALARSINNLANYRFNTYLDETFDSKPTQSHCYEAVEHLIHEGKIKIVDITK